MKYKKRSLKERLAVCRMLAEGAALTMVSQVSGVALELLKEWRLKYQIHGANGLENQTRRFYSDEEKKLLVLEFQNKSVPLLRFCIERRISHTQFRKWRKQYSGPGDIRRDLTRTSMNPANMKVSISEEDRQLSREELLEELAYLRAENALLKKVRALMAEKRARQLGNGRRPSGH